MSDGRLALIFQVQNDLHVKTNTDLPETTPVQQLRTTNDAIWRRDLVAYAKGGKPARCCTMMNGANHDRNQPEAAENERMASQADANQRRRAIVWAKEVALGAKNCKDG